MIQLHLKKFISKILISWFAFVTYNTLEKRSNCVLTEAKILPKMLISHRNLLLAKLVWNKIVLIYFSEDFHGLFVDFLIVLRKFLPILHATCSYSLEGRLNRSVKIFTVWINLNTKLLHVCFTLIIYHFGYTAIRLIFANELFIQRLLNMENMLVYS